MYQEQVNDLEIPYTELILAIRRPTGASKSHSIQPWTHKQELNWTRCFFSFKQAAKSSSIWPGSYHFSFMKILIQWSYTNRKENSAALDLSCRNLPRKNTTYYANHYHLRSFDLKQDMQILVAVPLGRHFQLGLRYPRYIPSMTWTFSHRLNYRMFLEVHALIKFSSTRKIRNSVEWSYGSYWWLPWRESKGDFTGESLAWTQSHKYPGFISMVFPDKLYIPTS